MDEERVSHSKSDNIEIMINDKEDDVIEKTFKLLLNRYEIGLETSVTVLILSLILFIYYIMNVIKLVLNKVDHI